MKKILQFLASLSDQTVIGIIALGIVILHTLANGQYGFHRDELDILMNARQLAWGYVAYPPFTPFIARIGLAFFGPSLVGMRFAAALVQGIVALLVGGMARDMGGKRLAQVLAVLAVAISPIAMTTGTLMQYMSFDYLWWVVLAFFVVRLLATNDPRWWLGIGAAIGMGMMTKYTVVFFIAGLAAAFVLTSMRRYFLSKWLWGGAGLALLIFLPNLIWQVQHDFISLDFLFSIHARDLAWGRGNDFLSNQLYVSINPFTLPLWLAGLAYTLFSAQGRAFRALGWMFLVTFVLLFATQGRFYYLSPAYPMLLAAGSVWFEGWLANRAPGTGRWVKGAAWAMLFIGGAIGVLVAKPVAPIHSPVWEIATDINETFVEMVGWQDLVAQVAEVYATIPEEEKPRTAIVAGNYGEAGALELYGGPYQLPPVISGANSLWARGFGDPAPETVITIGVDMTTALRFMRDCQAAGRITNAYGVDNEESTSQTGLAICRQPLVPWEEIWANMQWFQ